MHVSLCIYLTILWFLWNWGECPFSRNKQELEKDNGMSRNKDIFINCIYEDKKFKGKRGNYVPRLNHSLFIYEFVMLFQFVTKFLQLLFTQSWLLMHRKLLTFLGLCNLKLSPSRVWCSSWRCVQRIAR